MAEKKYILAFLPEVNADYAEKILLDFERRSNGFAIIRLTQKAFLSKFGYFLNRQKRIFESFPVFHSVQHLYYKVKTRISLKVRKKKILECVNPQLFKEGSRIGSKRAYNAMFRFSPKLVICFDGQTLSKLIYAKRKQNLNVKIVYIELKAKFNPIKLFYNCDAYLVQNSSSKAVLVENCFPANNVYAVNSYSLFKIDDEEAKKVNDKKFFATVLLNANQFSKRVVRKILRMFLIKHKNVKVYVSTGIDRKLLTFIESIPGIKDNRQFIITGNKDKFFKNFDYSIQNTAYSNFAYSVANEIVPIVLSLNKVIKSASFEFYQENDVAVCVKSIDRLSKMMETLLDDSSSESDIRKNNKALLASNSTVSLYDSLLGLANKLDLEQQI